MTNYVHEALDRTQDNENFIPQPSCSYDAREGSKDQSRACHGPIGLYNNERGVYSMSPASQLGTENSRRGETVYLTLRRRHPSGLSQVRSSVQETSRDDDFRQDNKSADWERCRIFDSEGSSCVAPESKDEEVEPSGAGRKRIDKEEENIQVMDGLALDEKLSIIRDSPGVERRSPISSMDDRKFINTIGGGSSSGSESQLKEMMTQQKRRIVINTSTRACSDLNQERINFPYGSPERCCVSKTQSKYGQQDDQNPSTHASGLPRSTSRRRATPVEVQTDVQRKVCDDGSNECNESSGTSLRNFKEDGNERIFPSLFVNCSELNDTMHFPVVVYCGV
jgi:hypothetical protein